MGDEEDTVPAVPTRPGFDLSAGTQKRELHRASWIRPIIALQSSSRLDVYAAAGRREPVWQA
jgi:hypothetical protein